MAGYGDDTAFTTWLTANGYTLPGGAPTPAILRQRGATYIDSTYGQRFPGQPASGAAQEREWPRTGATDRYGNALASDTVPSRVIEASFVAAYQEAVSPGSLSVVVDPSKRVKRQKVDTIEREFFEPGGDGAEAPTSSIIEGLLAPFLTGTAGEPWALVV